MGAGRIFPGGAQKLFLFQGTHHDIVGTLVGGVRPSPRDLENIAVSSLVSTFLIA